MFSQSALLAHYLYGPVSLLETHRYNVFLTSMHKDKDTYDTEWFSIWRFTVLCPLLNKKTTVGFMDDWRENAELHDKAKASRRANIVALTIENIRSECT